MHYLAVIISGLAQPAPPALYQRLRPRLAPRSPMAVKNLLGAVWP